MRKRLAVLAAGMLNLGISAAAVPTPIPSPAIYDANGVFVGTIAEASTAFDEITIRMLWQGRMVSLLVNSGGFLTSGRLHFITTDCTGTAYKIDDVVPQPTALVAPAVVISPGRVVYVRAPGGQIITGFNYGSYRRGSTCTAASGSYIIAYPMQRAGNIAPAYAVPFHIGPTPQP